MRGPRLKVGDLVQVVRGAGRVEQARGRVLKILTAKGKAIVEGVNTVYKHVRPDPRKGHRGGRIEKGAPVHLSNLALVDPKSGQIVRTALRLVDGKRMRVNKKTGEAI
jgi:large subunit ribosomal protein L24